MKVAIIGTGFGERVVAPVYRKLGCNVQVISPRNTDAVEAVCSEGVDLVSVHSPPFLHLQHVMCALKHGRAVLCDKPFGRNVSEACAMRDRARELGVLNFLNFEFRHHQARVRLKQMLADGAIGELRHISWTFIGSGLRHQTHRWLFDVSSGGGWIGAYGSHAIDTIRWLFGSEVVTTGGISRIETRTRLDPNGQKQISTAEDAFTAWFVMMSGGTASFDTAFSAPVHLPHRLILMGDAGALELVDERTIILRVAGQEPTCIEFAAPTADPHETSVLSWLTEVCAALRNGQQITPSFDDGVAVAIVMQQLRSNLIVDGAAVYKS